MQGDGQTDRVPRRTLAGRGPAAPEARRSDRDTATLVLAAGPWRPRAHAPGTCGDGNGDRNRHGTHAASTLFGRDVDGIRIGIARGVRDAFIAKMLRDAGGGTIAATFRALQDALDFGAKAISMSLG